MGLKPLTSDKKQGYQLIIANVELAYWYVAHDDKLISTNQILSCMFVEYVLKLDWVKTSVFSWLGDLDV